MELNPGRVGSRSRRSIPVRVADRGANWSAPLLSLLLLLLLLMGFMGGVSATSQDGTKHDRTMRISGRTSSQRERRSHVTGAPLSPLQAYIYSHAASVEALVVTADSFAGSSSTDEPDISSPSSERDSFNTRREKHDKELRSTRARQVGSDTQRTMFPLQNMEKEHTRRVMESPSSSSSSTGFIAGSRGSARVASLSGRYVVLSRTVAAPVRGVHGALRDSVFPVSLRRMTGGANASDGALVTPLSASTLPRQDKKENSMSPFLFARPRGAGVRSSRVFPEEALRRLANIASAYPRVNVQRATETRVPLVDGAHRRSVEAAAVDDPTSKRRQQQLYRDFEAARLSALEIHVVDTAHILVFLPSSEESATLLQAMADDSNDGVTWRVWDAFQSAEGGPQLKLSESLRRLVEEITRAPADGSATSFSVSSSSSVRRRESSVPGTTHEVTLWTARGSAAAVHVALTKSSRLSPYRTSSPTATPPSTCRLTIEPVEETADAVWVRIGVLSQPSAEDAMSGLHNASQEPTADAPAQQQQRHPATQRESCLRDILMALAAHPAVRWVEESYRWPEMLNKVVTKVIQQGSCGSYSSRANAYAVDNTEADRNVPLWDRGLNGTGEIIAIGDSGLDTESCYFHDPAEAIAYYPQVNLRHRKVISYQAYVSADGVVDSTDRPKGHGTHVAGIAAGYVLPTTSRESTSTTALYNGVAPGAKLFVRDMNDGTSTHLSLPSNLQEIFESAYNVGARISSNSWGFKTKAKSYLAVEKMFDTTVAERRDLLILAAAGNSGKQNVYVPARAKNVLTVGSHLNSLLSTLQNTVPEGSAYGVTYDKRRKPDLVAPGGGGGDKTTVVSAMAGTVPMCATTPLYGTSMATAAAAGAAAVVRQYLREEWKFADPSSALLRAALLHSTTALPHVDPLRSGFGRLDLSHLLSHRNHTVDKRLPPLEQWFADDAVVHDDEVHQFCFALTGLSAFHDSIIGEGMTEQGGSSCSWEASLTVTATLVWNDPGTAVEGSVRSQVHDLDLMLTTPHGHTFFSGADGVTRERFNTVEQVRVPLSGERNSSSAQANTSVAAWVHGFRVLVRGAEVRSTAGQTFALAVTGPGLAFVPECSTLFEQWRTTPTAPAGRERESNAISSAFPCPMNCTGHGTCDMKSLLCLCEPSYTSVDCAECNPAALCNGHGTCDTETMTCTCNPRGHFADARCATCQAGWYGPDCASTCTCLHGGVCDTATGLCSCVQDTALHSHGKGCFQGSECQYCCDGFGGPACNRRSYWCNTTGELVVVDDPNGGFIQINDFKSYGFSLTCRWAIRAQPGQQIQLEFISYDMVQSDALYVYDIVPNPAAASVAQAQRRQVRKLTGSMSGPLPVTTSTAAQMDLEFVSDWDSSGKGFVLYYRFTSCSEKCRLTNLTGPVGHWACGDTFGLPAKQCICEPPYVGWNCEEGASDISLLSRELSALQIANKRAWQDGELAWMLPRSVLTAVEVRLPVQLTTTGAAAADGDTSVPLAVAWERWRSPNVLLRQLTVPVAGMARLPLVVHGFSEVQLPLLTLPTPAFLGLSSAAAGTALGGGETEKRLPVTAQLQLRVQLQVDAAWLDNDASALELTLGVSAATEVGVGSRASAKGDNGAPFVFFNFAKDGRAGDTTEAAATVFYGDTTTPLSLNAFTFTPMALQKLFYCADVPMVEIAVPLNLLTNVSAPSNPPSSSPIETTEAAAGGGGGGGGGVREAEAAAEESHWTTRVVFTLLWKDAAGLKVPNVSVVDAVVFAHEVVLTKMVPMVAATGELPAAGSTVRGAAVEVSCHAVARVPVHTGEQVVEATTLPAAAPTRVFSTVRFVVLFFALCVGMVSGTVWVLWTQDRRRTTYATVQTVDEGLDMPVIGKRG
ncbi:subtilisin-like serine peptidase [Leptomonas pyrrhocoris]|uniref:Subtilisin-like serine peptidase n=1 Tax=Leptomonas pyrrhocoris TaxID=157538 RepID=A0A0M9G1V8_LEPPY|nr:subtilisin-like serine peptidase [Leptomonas pyrrhocoris]KPA80543.1 subtilisin-like serine peptidase [Leptomonas pyrrhocoris]|eukprot:XP_015658982.1 subtilisin-like serine peptidase [Leptomonas pyrrhocoris]